MSIQQRRIRLFLLSPVYTRGGARGRAGAQPRSTKRERVLVNFHLGISSSAGAGNRVENVGIGARLAPQLEILRPAGILLCLIPLAGLAPTR